ncbi:MAG: adenylyl cyclase [Candidatus Portnoybacteria bacterium CG06_land_8_20_14_3_00_39_12]|uniref:Adenylyl cyclase n=1 Tax=Candidatus Portnoybacteria bacterium CG06_land_8_20_14_3_00_39_12 TaxID=1974809 RepID=A0A2M7AXW8_9BACT|nr:MAG: adenylyl cyclase [Candidatus Portnoybacteria bacterium CG06_land_8_20_14_3_00_39_12]
MDIEYEATFINIGKDKIRTKLKKAGAKLIRPEFLQKRTVFNLPRGHKIKGGWLRIRDEGNKITITLKVVDGTRIRDQKEINLEVSDFEKANQFLTILGCRKKAYQENKRELWELGGVEIMLDEWPFLEPILEIEGKSEKAVKSVCKKLKLDYSKALFCAIGAVYSRKYGISEHMINNKTPKIIFKMKNPFKK